MLKVYYVSQVVRDHATNPVHVSRDEYLHICDLCTTAYRPLDPDDAFRFCQNVDSNWYNNPEHEWEHKRRCYLSGWAKHLVERGGLRSMMVGDIVAQVDSVKTRYFICRAVGWSEVELGPDGYFRSK